LNPIWFSIKIDEIRNPIIDDESRKVWEQALRVTKSDAMIVNTINGVGPQSIVAMTRYQYLEKIQEKYNEWPFLLVLLAECHYLINDIYGAYIRMQKVQSLIGYGTDTALDNPVINLRRVVE
jgi:hypothetical protein